jgi:HEAT repeat protein
MEESLREMRFLSFAILLICLGGCCGAEPTMAGSKWAGALRDPAAEARRKAAFTLGNIGISDPAVLPGLLGALNDADAGVRCEAILGLLKYGPAAKEAIPELTEVQKKDRDPRVRRYAAKALARLKEES